jgi:hypothetical protein
MFTAQRSERYFCDPLEFHPERWLPLEHPLCDTRYANDNLKAFFPFSIGPRQCTGREIAWSQTRLFLGKLLWSFDLEGVRGQEKSFDKDFKVYLLCKCEFLRVKLLPVPDLRQIWELRHLYSERIPLLYSQLYPRVASKPLPIVQNGATLTPNLDGQGRGQSCMCGSYLLRGNILWITRPIGV